MGDPVGRAQIAGHLRIPDTAQRARNQRPLPLPTLASSRAGDRTRDMEEEGESWRKFVLHFSLALMIIGIGGFKLYDGVADGAYVAGIGVAYAVFWVFLMGTCFVASFFAFAARVSGLLPDARTFLGSATQGHLLS